MSFRLATALDVRISGVSPGTSTDQIATALLRHSNMDTVRATEVAGLILAGQKVQVELHSKQVADLLAQELRTAGATVTVNK